MSKSDQSIHGIWGRWIFILAATGSAVGLGNIWKFPYITGENGGGAFVLLYLLCIALVGIPIMMAEVALGRKGRQSPINSVASAAKESDVNRKWQTIGWMGGLASFFILSFYSVIAGWALAYVPKMASGMFENADGAVAESVFNQLLADPITLLGWHSLFMVLTLVVIARGVNKGLESAIRILMPVLFILLLILLGFSLSSSGVAEAASFMFSFDFSKLSGDSVLVALGHAFFTLSLGMGSIMAYGAYMPRSASIGKTVLTIASLDTLVALVAGMCIFPVVFANGMEPGAGPGLMFQTLPLAFGHMPLGTLFGTLFFVLVSFAAWSSAISLAEPTVAWAVERGMSRVQATVIVGSIAWMLGIGTALSFNVWSGAEYQIFGQTVFGMLDFLTSKLMLPLGGLLIAIFVGWKMKKRKVELELNMKSTLQFNIWYATVRIFAPGAVAVVFVSEILKLIK